MLLKGANLFLEDNQEATRGFISLAEQQDPLIIVIHPILPTTGNGSSKGLFVVGRYLNSYELLNLGELVQLPISIISLDAKETTSDFLAAKQEILNGNDVFTLPLSQNQIGGFTVLDDVFGQPAYLLKIETIPLFV